MSGRVEVVGGGLGGLAAATSLAQSGYAVRVHERRPEFRDEGGGVSLEENAFRALDALGAAEDVALNGVALQHAYVRDHRDRPHMPPQFFSLSGRHFMATRYHLHQALLTAARRAGVELCTNSLVVAADPAGRLELAGGEQLEADLIVGADGIGSRVRRGMGIRARIVPMRYREGAALIQVDLPASRGGAAYSRWSGSRRMLYARLGDGYAFAVYGGRASDFEDSAAHPAAADGWRRAFRDEFETRVLERLAAENVVAVPISTVVCSRWSDGRLVLLGDAAHTMPPNRGQGAALAITDGLLLGRRLATVDRIADTSALREALDAWEADVRPPIRRTQRGSVIYCLAQSRWPRPLLGLRPAFFRQLSRTQHPDLKLLPARAGATSER